MASNEYKDIQVKLKSELWNHITSTIEKLECPLKNKMKILYVSWFGTSGYARVAADIIRCLDTFADVNFQIINTYNASKSYIDENHDLLKHCVCNITTFDVIILHTVPEEWPKYIKQFRNTYINTKILGITVWETSCIPKNWKVCIEQTDGISVPCIWNEHIFKQSIDIPVDTVFHPKIDSCTTPKKIDAVHNILARYKYIFYTINEFNNRKSIKELMEVFSKTFPNHGDVVLYIKTSGDVTENNANKLLSSLNVNNIFLDYGKYTNDEISWIHDYCSCFVSLTKAEGTGLSIIEAGLRNKPIIVTKYSGLLEYIKTASYVDYDIIRADNCSRLHVGFQKCLEQGFCSKNIRYNSSYQFWANPNLETAKQLLIEHYENDIRITYGNKEYIESAFNKYVCANQFKQWILKHIGYSEKYF
jgi:glycosyltransferase involved in cell wall biosynthesis